MTRDEYERSKRSLQIELLKLQSWIKDTGQKVVLVFEGRDAAGKGGTIKRFTEHLNPRGARVVALEKPTEREEHQWYFQRYVQHLPTAGEIVLFDRSWYNRAGVERVMGFCTQAEYEEFMRQAPEFERMLVRSDIHLIKFWFSVSKAEQRTRFVTRQVDPVRRWKLSPMDLASLDKWDDYTEAKESMFFYTDTRGRALDRPEEQRQEARPGRRAASRAAHPRLRRQGPGRRRPAGPADPRSGRARSTRPTSTPTAGSLASERGWGRDPAQSRARDPRCRALVPGPRPAEHAAPSRGEAGRPARSDVRRDAVQRHGRARARSSTSCAGTVPFYRGKYASVSVAERRSQGVAVQPRRRRRVRAARRQGAASPGCRPGPWRTPRSGP